MNFLTKKTNRNNSYNKSSKNNSSQITKSLQNKMEENLLGSKFRILNEKLYTIDSNEAYDYFKNNREDFLIYHKGFDIQASKWPVNPNQIIINELMKNKYKNKVIADLGCGEAFIAQKLKDRKIHSFDFVKINEFITECDIKNVPMKNDIVDLAIFCLSLMGKNFVDFLKEAKRILKLKGILIISEILSRIVDENTFIQVLENLGFVMKQKRNVKNYFVLYVLRLENKVENKEENDQTFELNSFDILKPCLYKKR